MQRSFVMIKPDGVQRELVGEIITKFEKKGVQIVAMKLMKLDKETAEKHYEVHKGKHFFEDLINFITSGPVVAMVMQGEGIISVIRGMIGATAPKDAMSGTIRGDYVLDAGQNIIHASDSKENAEKEIKIFFKDEEIMDYNLASKPWIYSIRI